MNIDAAEIYNQVIFGFNRSSALIYVAPNQFCYIKLLYYTVCKLINMINAYSMMDKKVKIFLKIFLFFKSIYIFFLFDLLSFRYASIKY